MASDVGRVQDAPGTPTRRGPPSKAGLVCGIFACAIPILLGSVHGRVAVSLFLLATPVSIWLLGPLGGGLTARAMRRDRPSSGSPWRYVLGALVALPLWLVACFYAGIAAFVGVFSFVYCAVEECYEYGSTPSVPATMVLAAAAGALTGSATWWCLRRPDQRARTAALALGGVACAVGLLAVDLAYGGPATEALRSQGSPLLLLDLETGGAVRSAALRLSAVTITLAALGVGSAWISRRSSARAAGWPLLAFAPGIGALLLAGFAIGSHSTVPAYRTGESFPVLSGDGRWVLVDRCVEGDCVLALRPTSGGEGTVVADLSTEGGDPFIGAISDDGGRVVSVGYEGWDSFVYLHELADATVTRMPSPRGQRIASLAGISGDGETVLIGAPYSGSMEGLWVVPSGGGRPEPASIGPNGDDLDAPVAVLSDDGSTLAMLGAPHNETTGSAYVRDLETGETSAAGVRLSRDAIYQGHLAMSDDGAVVVFWARRGHVWAVQVWDTATGTVTSTERPRDAPRRPGGVTVSGSGNVVAFTVRNGYVEDIYRFDRRTDRTRLVATVPGSGLRGPGTLSPQISLSDNGRILAVPAGNPGTSDSKVGLLKLRTGAIRWLRPGREGI